LEVGLGAGVENGVDVLVGHVVDPGTEAYLYGNFVTMI
jgi:hypothetical protein